ncbi:hypothetical protein OEA41_005677 [Lepraria neglecta]|uniref:Uncharacterized protein n=1 Tax=Lepraria neglecta TaxID=209136 RepID=A0AAD9Z7H9_9LECA|nr:hypothetical protein OEA41_005677 [Lepraria neglecta]
MEFGIDDWDNESDRSQERYGIAEDIIKSLQLLPLPASRHLSRCYQGLLWVKPRYYLAACLTDGCDIEAEMVSILQPAVEMQGDAIAGFLQSAKEQEEEKDDGKERVWERAER